MLRFSQTSTAARTALVYITMGALIVIWTSVWYSYLRKYPPSTDAVYYICAGLLVTGVTLIGIGFGIGRIGREARHADLPPEVTPVTPPSAPQAPLVHSAVGLPGNGSAVPAVVPPPAVTPLPPATAAPVSQIMTPPPAPQVVSSGTAREVFRR